MIKWLIFLSFCSSLAYGQLPVYEAPEILARANIQDGYNLPPFSFISNSSPVINNKGDVVFKVLSLEGTNSQGLWLKMSQDPLGKVVYIAPDQRFITDPSLNDQSVIVFNLYDEGVTDGLFSFDSKTLEVDQILDPNQYRLQHYTYSTVINSGEVFFRGTNDSNERSFFRFDGLKAQKILSEGIDLNNLKASYLFRPSFDENGKIVFKTRIGDKGEWDESMPDAIALMTPFMNGQNLSYDLQYVARDKDFDSSSQFTSFGNSVAISSDGKIAFMATMEDGKKSIVMALNKQLIALASEGLNSISEIELFSPKINSQGQVLFRAKDTNGHRALFIADQDEVKKIIAEGDDIPTDLGTGKILANPNYPGFGGEVDFNDNGDIVFHAIIVSSEDHTEWGEAIYKLSPKK